MDAEKLAMQRRIDNLQRHIDHLHGVITEQERQAAKLTVELEAVKRERDAAFNDIDRYCRTCKFAQDGDPTCSYCRWEWRGLCKENGGIEND